MADIQKPKPKKMAGMATFKNNFATMSIKPLAPNTQAPAEEKSIAPESAKAEALVETVKEIPLPVKPEADETNTVVKKEPEKKAEKNEPVKKEKAASKKTATPQRRNPNKIVGEKKNSTGRELNKSLNFTIGKECEEMFIFCHRKQRMSRNSYFLAILEAEKKKYESNMDQYIEKNLDKLMEEKTVPASTEKKITIRASQDIFDFVTDVAYDFYCKKDRFIRFAIRREYERIKKNG